MLLLFWVGLLVDCSNLFLGVKGIILNTEEGLLYNGVAVDTQHEMEYISNGKKRIWSRVQGVAMALIKICEG